MSSPRAVAQAPRDWRLKVKSEDETELPADQEVEAADLSPPRCRFRAWRSRRAEHFRGAGGCVLVWPRSFLPACVLVGGGARGPRGCVREGGSVVARAGVSVRVLQTPAVEQEGPPCVRVGEAGRPLSSRCSSPAAHESSHLQRGTQNCVGMATRVRTAAIWVSSGFSLVFEKLSLSADVCTVHLFLGNGPL